MKDDGWKHDPERDYEEFLGTPHKEETRREIAEVVGPAKSVLDCGGGLGHLGKFLDCEEYTVLDKTEEFEPDICADLLDIPLPDDSYEVCVTRSVLQHIRRWKRALSEIVRVAERRVVLTERSGDVVDIVRTEPVLRRVFSPSILMDELERYGEVEFKWSEVDDRRGIYELVL